MTRCMLVGRNRLVFLTIALAATMALAPAVTRADGNVNFTLGGRAFDEDYWEPNEGMGLLGVNVDFGPDKWPIRVALGLSGSSAENEGAACRVCDGLGLGHLGLGDLDIDGLELGDLDFGDLDFGDLDFGDLPFGDLPFGFDFPGLGVQNVRSTVAEFSAGVLYRPRGERKLIPFVGGGLSFMTVEQEIERLGGRSISDDDTTVGIYVNGGVYWRLGKRFNIGFDGRVVTGTSVQLFGQKGDANYGQLGLILGWGW